MLSLLVLLAVVILSYLVGSLLVGISFFALFGKRIGVAYNRVAFLSLLVVFALLDVYWVPSIAALDITMSLGNSEVARILQADSTFRLNDILAFGWFDVVVWLVQTAIGYFIGLKVYSRNVRAA